MSQGMEKREITSSKKAGITVTEILIVAMLIAAGAVLKGVFNVAFSFTPLKPNSVIAMYSLAILLIRPKFLESLAIGLVAGVVCTFLPGVLAPGANIVSETLGAVALVLLMKMPFELKIGKVPFYPAVLTFFTTLVSGYAFFLAMKMMLLSGLDLPKRAEGMTVVGFSAIIFGTALANAIIVSVLYPALRAVIRKRTP
ncbi:MAG: hypothetical protein FWH04_02085 [Oscillospiraceae bacterium]|nr:hypothetical protein [Oscillospiraceae bacterium]